MPKRKPKKPTEPFGYLAFSKDGRVRKHIEQLSPVKADQEGEVGHRLAVGLSKLLGIQFTLKPCGEDDHDFLLVSEERTVLVQATEIPARAYLRPLSHDDYINSNHHFSTFTIKDSQHYGVDNDAMEAALLKWIKTKINKHYAKPEHPLWLLIWTVDSMFPAFWIEGGRHRVSVGVEQARAYLSENGAGPFDEVWFLHLNGLPKRIWLISDGPD